MNQVLKIAIFFIGSMSAGAPCFAQKTINQKSTGAEILEKTYNTLHEAQRISYDYQRVVNYASDDYYHELSATTYLDDQSDDKVLGFKYQIETVDFKMIYNGSESFELNKRNNTIAVAHQPDLDHFSSISVFLNSIITLKQALPIILSDNTIVKTLSDTTISGKNYYLASFVLENKTLGSLGSFNNITNKIDFLYQIIIDQGTFLPLKIIQTNNITPTDYVLTTFSNYQISPNNLPELSWYYTTYTQQYKPADEQLPVLIKANAKAPFFNSVYFNSPDSVNLNMFAGRVVLLEFWFKNCGSCIASVPKINALAEKYQNKDVAVIGVNSTDNIKNIQFFYEKHQPAYKSILDPAGKIKSDYGVYGFPTIVILDKKGFVLYAGDVDLEKVNGAIEKALK